MSLLRFGRGVNAGSRVVRFVGSTCYRPHYCNSWATDPENPAVGGVRGRFCWANRIRARGPASIHVIWPSQSSAFSMGHGVGRAAGSNVDQLRPPHGQAATTCATAAVSRLAYGKCKNSFGPWALLFGPRTPQTIIWAFGKPCCSKLIRGIVPPWPI